jgi:hypothetical protein
MTPGTKDETWASQHQSMIKKHIECFYKYWEQNICYITCNLINAFTLHSTYHHSKHEFVVSTAESINFIHWQNMTLWHPFVIISQRVTTTIEFTLLLLIKNNTFVTCKQLKQMHCIMQILYILYLLLNFLLVLFRLVFLYTIKSHNYTKHSYIFVVIGEAVEKSICIALNTKHGTLSTIEILA